MNTSDKSAVLAKISSINAVDGFDPALLAVDYTDMNTGETRKRLPVMAQMAWFRLKYPEGRFTLSVIQEKDYFIATAKVFAHFTNPQDQYLSEATASRGPNPYKPSVSAREWAQTAALGIALRNAGFGLQFSAAGEGYDDLNVNESGQLAQKKQEPLYETEQTASADTGSTQPEDDPIEKAKRTLCPIKKYSGKTLGDVIMDDPGAIVWIAHKFPGDPVISAAAKLLCEYSVANAGQ